MLDISQKIKFLKTIKKLSDPKFEETQEDWDSEHTLSRVVLLEQQFQDLLTAQKDINELMNVTKEVLIEAYMDNDSSLTKVDTIVMIEDLT